MAAGCYVFTSSTTRWIRCNGCLCQFPFVGVIYIAIPFVFCPNKGIAHHYQIRGVDRHTLQAQSGQHAAQIICDQADGLGRAVDVTDEKMLVASPLLWLSDSQPIQAIPATQEEIGRA